MIRSSRTRGSSPTWATHHRRGDVLAAVIAEADRRGDGRLPLDVPGVASTFGDELTLLGALQLKWHTRLAGRIERALASEPLDLPAAVVSAWADAADQLPGVRAVLDRHRDHPLDEQMATVMAKATAKERTMLAMMAGLCSVGDAGAAPLGAALEERARLSQLARTSEPDDVRPSLLDRLRAALVA